MKMVIWLESAHSVIAVSTLNIISAMRCRSGNPGLIEPRCANIVRLNVGGRFFDTTSSTLQGATFFQSCLEGSFGIALDETGRLFVDRSGEMFDVILQFLRTGVRPPQHVLDANHEALLAECDFFGCEWLAHIVKGQTSPYDLRPEDRRIRISEHAFLQDNVTGHDGMLMDVFGHEIIYGSPSDVNSPLLFENMQRPVRKGTFRDFLERLNQWSGDLINDLQGIPNLVIAGGAVLGSLVDGAAGDIDIFLVGCKTDEEAMRCLHQVFEAVKKNQARVHGQNKKLLVTRSRNAVTFFRVSSNEVRGPPVQVILTLNQTIQELLVSFDIDCCCFAWPVASSSVLTTPRGMRALRNGVNIMDTAFDSPSYIKRLEKYAHRGFALAIPGFTPSRVSHRLHSSSYFFVTRCDLLLRVADTVKRAKEMEVAVPEFIGFQHIKKKKITFTAAAQTGHSVHGLERLVVLGSGGTNIQWVDVPPVCRMPRCDKCSSEQYAHRDYGYMTVQRVAASTGVKGEYQLLWGDGPTKHECFGEVNLEEYDAVPLNYVASLLETHCQHTMHTEGEAMDDVDGWWTGGVMHRLTDAMRSKGNLAYNVANSFQAAKLHSRKSILFVYDFATDATCFDQLRFVNDSARHPLATHLCPTHFEERYGIPAKIKFQPRAPRTPSFFFLRGCRTRIQRR